MGGPLGGPASTVPRFVRVASARSRNYSGIVPASNVRTSANARIIPNGSQVDQGIARKAQPEPEGEMEETETPADRKAPLCLKFIFRRARQHFCTPSDDMSDIYAPARVMGFYIIFR